MVKTQSDVKMLFKNKNDAKKRLWQAKKAHGLARKAGVRGQILLSDAVRMPDPEAFLKKLGAGSVLILRLYDLGEPSLAADDGEQQKKALKRLIRIAKQLSIQVFLSGSLRLARRYGLGLHLREGDLYGPDRYRLRALRGKNRKDYINKPALKSSIGCLSVTAAVHSRKAIMQAQKLDIEALLVSPVFPTLSHVGAKTLGVHRLARLLAGRCMPLIFEAMDKKTIRMSRPPYYFALGGINKSNAGRLKGLGTGRANLGGLTGIAAIEGWKNPQGL